MTNRTVKPISRYPVPAFETLPKDIQQRLLAFKGQMGFIPNVFSALAYRPEEFRAFVAYLDALIFNKSSGLSAAEKEMLIIAHSSYNGCLYCVQSHSAKLRMFTGNQQLADQIAVNYHEADITPREKAIIDFAMKITVESAKIDESDFDLLRIHGLNDEDIWDVAAIAAFFNLSNRMMNFAAIRPNDELYTMGR